MVVNSETRFLNHVDVGTDLVVSKTISAKNVNEDIRNKEYTLNNKIDTYSDSWVQLGQDLVGDVSDQNGISVSLSADGTIVAIGANSHDGNSSSSLDNRGRTRIYQYSSNTWIQLGEDLSGDTGDHSGGSVSLSADGTIVAIGAPYHDVGSDTNEGRTRIYQYSSSTWIQLGQDLIGDDSDYSGFSVSLSADGTIVAIGATDHDVSGNNNEGRTRIYQYSSNTWIQLGQDLIEDDGDSSGISVSLSADGTIVAIGAYFHDSTKGRTRIYQYSSNTWSKLGQDLVGDPGDHSGYSVSLSADGTIVAIGAKDHDASGGSNHGRTRIYHLSEYFKSNVRIDNDLNVAGDAKISGTTELKGDVVIGEDSTDLMVVNSSSNFYNNVDVEGDINLTGNLKKNGVEAVFNNWAVNGNDIYRNSNVGIGTSTPSTKLDVAGDAKISGTTELKGDVVIGEDSTDLMVVNSKLHIPGGESGQILTKGTDGSIEYGVTVDAITSLFTQEQALAGAGGTADFTAYGLYGNDATDVITVMEVLVNFMVVIQSR